MAKPISIRADFSQVAPYLSKAGKESKFIQALFLTRMAKRGQKAVQETLQQKFTIRRVSWAKSGIRITKATKQRLASEVMDINPYMLQQEEGGTKIPFGKHICVPLRGARPTPSRLIRKDDFPSAVMSRGGFIQMVNGNLIMFERTKRRSKKKGTWDWQTKNGNMGRISSVLPMYLLISRAQIKKRYGFEDTIRKEFEANFEKEFVEVYEEVMGK
jgi:hypothetical protein